MERSAASWAASRTRSGRPTGRRWATVILLLVAVSVVVWVVRSYPLWTSKEVVIAVDDVEVGVSTRARTVEEVLAETGISLRPEDEVHPALDALIQNGERITVRTADVVVVTVDGEERAVAVVDGTVRDALVRAGISMGSLDRVVPVRETPLEDGMRIEVIRVVQEVIDEFESIPFRTLRWAEPQLEKGKERIVREGKEGTLKKSVRLTYENGQMVHRQELGHEVVEEPVARIIGIGTRESVNVIETTAGSLRYVDVLEMEATAYYPGPESTGEWSDGYTYTGLIAGRGVVAVDPEVIPLGTRLYIPGYGLAIAADIGGAIKGHRIDLGFPTYEEAIQYGRQHGVKVYILED